MSLGGLLQRTFFFFFFLDPQFYRLKPRVTDWFNNATRLWMCCTPKELGYSLTRCDRECAAITTAGTGNLLLSVCALAENLIASKLPCATPLFSDNMLEKSQTGGS